MANVLAKIVEDKRVEVAKRKQEMPLESFIDGLTPSKKDFYAALDRTKGKSHAGFILECKKASPSKGLIRPDFDVKEIASIYDKYAAAISVLTDEKYFQGTFEYLKTVTDFVSCPVLNKDFFVDTYQVHLARYYGADAILLMLSVLSDDEYKALEDVAKQYKLAILTEVSTPEELTRAIDLNAKLIGINNRNLRDLSTDITRTFEFAPDIPEDRIIISESGIYTNQQVREIAPAVDGFLVGSSVMAQDDVDLACRKLIFGENKVCGLTAPEFSQSAQESGAVYGGLIFADKSPRFVNKAQAQEIVKQVPSLGYVGVFVDHDITEVSKIAAELNLTAVQLHGKEDQSYIDTLKAQLPKDCQIWKAVAVHEQIPALTLNQIDRFLFDGKQPGSGTPFDWRALANTEQDISDSMLAGGLNAENIDNALALVVNEELAGLDLNSGVEQSPGKKCRDKLNTAFAKIRNY